MSRRQTMMSDVQPPPVPFTPSELSTLRAHGIVLFADRVIFDAQPPMAAAAVAQVQRSCAGPLPDQLLSLWQVTAGGQLDYDLTLPMLGHQEAISWVELFFMGSDGYHDLQGWIDHELELIAETAKRPRLGWPRQTKLTHLPFGGFEYCDRIYIGVAKGAEHGQVVAWKQGLPPAWTGQLHEDSVAELAPSLMDAFARLHLDEDPLSPVSDFFAGQSLLQYLDEQRGHGLDPALRDKLVHYYRRAVLDWASPLSAGTLTQDPALAQVALNHAVALDDPALVARLGAAGVSLDAPLRGSAVAVEVALMQHHYAAAAELVGGGATVPSDVLRYVKGPIPTELTARLLAAGAEPEMTAVIDCVAGGAPASARLIVAAGASRGVDVPTVFGPVRDAALAELEADLASVLDPAQNYSHYLGADGLAERIERLRSFSLTEG